MDWVVARTVGMGIERVSDRPNGQVGLIRSLSARLTASVIVALRRAGTPESSACSIFRRKTRAGWTSISWTEGLNRTLMLRAVICREERYPGEGREHFAHGVVCVLLGLLR